MSNEKYGFVYIWFDIKYKRYYIGCHWGNIHDGYICSSTWMRNSFNRRPQDFRRRILKSGLDRDEMYLEEQKYLNMININEIKPFSSNPRYYNLSLSSKNPWHKYEDSIKTIGQKISASKTGKSVPCTPEKAKAISEAKKRSFDKRRRETGAAITEKHRLNLSRCRKGKTHTEEWKEQASKRLKQQWANGTRKNSKNISDEHKQKISNALKGRQGKPISDEHRQKISKTWIVVSPTGVETQITNLKRFCDQYGLANTNITKKSGSKGWKAKLL